MVKKFLQIVTLGMIGMTLMGSTVSCGTDFHNRNELYGFAKQYSAPIWSEDGSHIAFAHPPGGVLVDLQRAIPVSDPVLLTSTPTRTTAASGSLSSTPSYIASTQWNQPARGG